MTVDSGASDTVIPPHLLNLCALIHTSKVGTGYEEANGDIVHNLGERRCIMRVAEESKIERHIAFQVFGPVHNPLLAVSSIARQSHQGVFAEQDAHIRLAGGGKMQMRHVNGKYELDMYIRNPGFTRPSVR